MQFWPPHLTAVRHSDPFAAQERPSRYIDFVADHHKQGFKSVALKAAQSASAIATSTGPATCCKATSWPISPARACCAIPTPEMARWLRAVAMRLETWIGWA